MIIFDMRSQWLMLLCSLAVGIALGVLYDIFRISRLFLTLPSECTSTRYYRMLPRVKIFAESKQVTGDIDAEPDALSIRLNNFAVGVVAFVEDITYFSLSAVILSVFLYNLNTGKVRGFVLIGAFCGFMLYLLTVGRVTLFFGELIVFLIRSAASFVFLRLLLPLTKTIYRFVSFIYIHTIGRLRDKLRHKAELRARAKRQRQLCDFCSRLGEYVVAADNGIPAPDTAKSNRRSFGTASHKTANSNRAKPNAAKRDTQAPNHTNTTPRSTPVPRHRNQNTDLRPSGKRRLGKEGNRT